MQYTDPVCGMKVDESTPHKSRHGDRTIFFCSDSCKGKFEADPRQYESKEPKHDTSHEARKKSDHYGRLLIMTVISFLAMYALMYAMVDRLANVYPSFNQFYMAGLMTAAMVVIELVVMSGMYPNKKMNALLVGISVIGLAAFYGMIRQQTAIADRQFVKSMIPHHAGAILMCEQASLQNAGLKQLCREIVRGQQQEIEQMKAKLRELDEGER